MADDNDPTVKLAEAQAQLAGKDRALAIERAARAEAESRGTRSAAEAARYKDTLQRTAGSQIDTTIKGLETEATSLKKDYADALAEGDFAKAADIQMQMATNATLQLNAKGTKTQLEQKPEPPAAGGVDKESYISRQSARTAAWLRQHDEYFDDPKLQSKVTGAHHLAIGNGLQIDSDEYFEFIEQQTGMDGTQKAADPPPHQPKLPKPGPRTPAAPPTRDGTALNRPANLRPGDRYIPPEMKAAADMCGVPPEQYYDETLRLIQENRISDRFGIMGNR